MSVVLRSRTVAFDAVDDPMHSWSQASVDELSRDCVTLCTEISATGSGEISSIVMRLAMRINDLSRFGSDLAQAAQELLQFAADELPQREWSTEHARQVDDGVRLLRVAFGARDDALAVCALRHLRAGVPESACTRI